MIDLNEAQAIALLITSATGAIVGVGTMLLQAANFFASRRRDVKLNEVHDLVNGQTNALHAAIGDRAFAEGKAAGIAAERQDPQTAVNK